MRSPRITCRQYDIRLERRARMGAAEVDSACRSAEPHHLCIAPRSGRKALRSHVKRLEKVRLPGTVGTVKKYDTGLESKLQAGVRAEVPERDLANDQPASRIGMIRYQKLSSGEAMRPGRKRLISLS